MQLENIMNEIIILFDEQGTPTFRSDRDTKKFLGVCVAYNLKEEDKYFKEADNLFGLSNSKPLKNNKIKTSRAIEIAKLISNFDIFINIATVDLENNEFQNVISLYEEFGNLIRERERKIRQRPKSQIIYSQILFPQIFRIIKQYIGRKQSSANFSVFIDNWAFPENDLSLALELPSEIITEKMNEINKIHFPNVKISCNQFELLVEDSNRKRFVDVIASILSRKFKDTNHEKYVEDILEIISTGDNVNVVHNEFTEVIINHIRESMDDMSRYR